MGSISSPDTATTPGGDAHLRALPGDRGQDQPHRHRPGLSLRADIPACDNAILKVKMQTLLTLAGHSELATNPRLMLWWVRDFLALGRVCGEDLSQCHPVGPERALVAPLPRIPLTRSGDVPVWAHLLGDGAQVRAQPGG